MNQSCAHPAISKPAVLPSIKTLRGFMLDSARCLEVRSYYRRFIDFVSARGVNLLVWHFTDDQGCSLQLESVENIGSPNAYSKTEMRELLKYASDRGVEIVPELASLGHSRYLTRLPAYQHLNEAEAHFTGMCPVSDETRAVIRRLIEETADVFDSRNFHVGLDEVNIGGHPLTAAALQSQTRADLLANYAGFLHGVLSGLDLRMWMWGDCLLKHPEMMARVPRDVVICNWQYTPEGAPATTQKLLDAGFDVVCCSALISHDQPLFPGERFALPNVRSLQSQHALTGTGRVLGHVNTIWTPVRFIADSLWLGVDLAATILRDEAEAGPYACIRTFGQTFYGLTDDSIDRFVEVGQLLISESPMRNEWLPVVKLDPVPEHLLPRIKAASGKWSHAFGSLLAIEPSIRQHVVEFQAFSLLIEMLAHTYDAAGLVSEPDVTPASLTRILKRGEALIGRISDTWDRERFADDPRKLTAPIASFQNDHLIPNLEKGLASLRAKLAERTQAASMSPDGLSIVAK